jgi:peptidoglycan/LPS O-acetylase OafA/YrhL
VNERLIEGLKTVLFGLAVCGGLLYMFFFATAGSIQVAVLLGTIAMLLWFGTAHPARLVDANGKPQWRLFMLAIVGLALLLSAMVALSSGTMLVTLAVGVVAIAVGVVRAIRHGLRGQV